MRMAMSLLAVSLVDVSMKVRSYTSTRTERETLGPPLKIGPSFGGMRILPVKAVQAECPHDNCVCVKALPQYSNGGPQGVRRAARCDADPARTRPGRLVGRAASAAAGLR